MPGSSAGTASSWEEGGGLALINPGRKKDAGDTPWLALKPPHPAAKTKRLAHAAVRSNFHCNLTKGQYKCSIWHAQHLIPAGLWPSGALFFASALSLLPLREDRGHRQNKPTRRGKNSWPGSHTIPRPPGEWGEPLSIWGS